ncbi:hypothetical protein [Euzebya sp.]|uniref:hypothetical protein n=1 Tax=Euzebya sp. TaxID=1971409 RepID=UPI003515E9A1
MNDQIRPTAASQRTVNFLDPRTGRVVRTIRGWAETTGPRTEVESSKWAGAGSEGDLPVMGLTKTTEDITLTTAFPIDVEPEVRRWLRNHITSPVEYIDQPIHPQTKEPLGKADLYRGFLKGVVPPGGGRSNTAEAAEIQCVLTVRGVVG